MNNVYTDVAIVGAGPAGMSAAIEAAKSGAKVCLIDENKLPGGQLFKQIHKFFGSQEHSAGTRGFRIAQKLVEEVLSLGVNLMLDTIVWGIFPGLSLGVTTAEKETFCVQAKKVIIATGAAENSLLFEGNTLPGVMGAGAAQTLVNIRNVRPGNKALVVGSGNVGLIVSYQLMQAGIEVVALIEAADKIGGYMVHASKIRRAGIPIYLRHTILRAEGKESVEKAVISQLDEAWKPINGKEKEFDVDFICLAVGLHPLAELCWMIGCQFKYSPILGGHLPAHDEDMQTTVNGLYIAGDVSGIEEASIAMEEGKLAGLAVAEALGFIKYDIAKAKKTEVKRRMEALRSGAHGEIIAKEKRNICGGGCK
jgi:thioredoxin reductase